MRGGLAPAVVLVVAAAGCRTPPPATPDDDGSLPRHLVVLLHGVLGNQTHFGAMAEALSAQLPRADERFRWEPVPFEYDTMSATADTRAFAEDLGAFLVAQMPGGPAPGERISFVGHSQGGLVALDWMARAADGDAAVHPEMLPALSGVVTLATPFWGTKLATFTKVLEPLRKESALPDVTPAAQQLIDMSLGSDANAVRRRQGIRVAEGGVPEALAHVRMLNLGGYVEWLKGAAPLSAGEDEYEDDTAVPLPSSRASFLYGQATRAGYPPHGDTLPVSSFREVRAAPYRLVNAIHLSPVVDLPQLARGVAQVQSACIDDPGCDHPTFAAVVAFLAGQTTSNEPGPLPRMTSFLLEVEVRPLPGGPSGFDVEVVVDDALPAGVSVGRLLEPYGEGQSVVAGDPGVQRFYFFGTARGAWTSHGFDNRTVPFTVRAPGYRPRRVEAAVRPTWSTWVEVTLDPHQSGGATATDGGAVAR